MSKFDNEQRLLKKKEKAEQTNDLPSIKPAKDASLTALVE